MSANEADNRDVEKYISHRVEVGSSPIDFSDFSWEAVNHYHLQTGQKRNRTRSH